MPGQLSVHDHHDLAGIPSFNFPGRVPDVLMSPLDVDRSAVRPPQWPINKRASFPSTSLSHVHISDALLRSPDNGATLVFMKKNLTDIGQEAAEELAKLGRESPDDEGCVERYAQSTLKLYPDIDVLQNCAGIQSSRHSSNGVRAPVAFALPQPQEQQLFCLPRCRTSFLCPLIDACSPLLS